MKRRTPLVLIGIAIYGFLAFDLWRDVIERDSFSWMDPYQYYAGARDVAFGLAEFENFPAASFYPLVLAPFLRIRDSIGFALATNAGWMLVLAVAVHLVCRRLRLRTPPVLVAAAVFSSPLLIGLSRELYLEYAVSALVALHLAFWFQAGRFQTRRYVLLFSLLVMAGSMVKMTYPVFLVFPLAVEVGRSLAARDFGRVGRILAATALPALLVLLAVRLFHPGALAYYASLGNTRIPVMKLIGPPEVWSAASFLYYVNQVFKNHLFLLSAFLPLTIWRGAAADEPSERPAHARLDLWLWFLGPLVLFTFQVVKEARHVAPCVLPAVLLMVIGLENLRSATLRRVLLSLMAAAALAQYVLATHHVISAPYFLDRPMRTRLLKDALFEAAPDSAGYVDRGQHRDESRWLYTRSILISGFRPNEALTLAWTFRPGVVINVDEFGSRDLRWRSDAYREYTDLFMLCAVNTYNRRSGWNGDYRTLSAEQALAGADALVMAVRRGDPPPRCPGFDLAGTLEWYRGEHIAVLLPRHPPASSFREAYAVNYLAANPSAPHEEMNAILLSLLLDHFLRTGDVRSLALPAGFPDSFVPSGPTKDIYFMPIYFDLKKRLEAAIRAASGGLGGTTAEPETERGRLTSP